MARLDRPGVSCISCFLVAVVWTQTHGASMSVSDVEWLVRVLWRPPSPRWCARQSTRTHSRLHRARSQACTFHRTCNPSLLEVVSQEAGDSREEPECTCQNRTRAFALIIQRKREYERCGREPGAQEAPDADWRGWWWKGRGMVAGGFQPDNCLELFNFQGTSGQRYVTHHPIIHVNCLFRTRRLGTGGHSKRPR